MYMVKECRTQIKLMITLKFGIFIQNKETFRKTKNLIFFIIFFCCLESSAMYPEQQ